MCAVKFAHVGSSINDLKTYEIEEKSYDPEGQIKGLTQDNFDRVSLIREIAAVCTLNNKSDIVFEDKKFNKIGEPTEAALKVAAEKLGRFDKSLGKVNYQ